MRGKLRDKHTKHDSFKREIIERRRPGRRETRIAILLEQELGEQDLEEMQDEGHEGDESDEQADRILIRITKLTQK